MIRKIWMLIPLMIAFSAQAQTLKTMASIRTAVFQHPENGPYVEVYLSLSGDAITYTRNQKYLYQGGVDVQLVIMDGATVINFDKYRLNAPQLVDSTSIDFTIIDQQRLSIPPKALSLEVTITDMHDSTNKFLFTEALLPDFNNTVSFSDIQLIDTFYRSTVASNFLKNGYEMKPYPINFFPDQRNNIVFYGEIYNTDKFVTDDQFLVTFNIESSDGSGSTQRFYQYQKSQKSPVISYLRNIDITDLPSGNYNLLVEVRNKQNDVIYKKVTFFQRLKKGAISTFDNLAMVNTEGTFVDEYSSEQLNYFLEVMQPRATAEEARLIASLSPRVEDDMKKKFLYNFWLERNQGDPYGAWKEYLQLVKEVNDAFSTPSRQGYRTDRGRVYLEYGRPYDRVTSVNEPGAYPYEIWFYTTLPDKQTNVGFAFYEPSGVSNDYVLIHSNAVGELRDPRWKVRIYENVASPQEVFDFDNTKVQENTNVFRAIDMYNF
jgi:GWxTD domain-containing protein